MKSGDLIEISNDSEYEWLLGIGDLEGKPWVFLERLGSQNDEEILYLTQSQALNLGKLLLQFGNLEVKPNEAI